MIAATATTFDHHHHKLMIRKIRIYTHQKYKFHHRPLALISPGAASCHLPTSIPVTPPLIQKMYSSILESRSPGVVWFYSEKECPQCGEIAEMYEAAAKKMTAWGLTMGAVNVDNEPKLAKEVGAPKFPPMMNVSARRLRCPKPCNETLLQ